MKVYFLSLGCDKNKVDSEKLLLFLIKKFNIVVVSNPEECDVVIVNTCAFIKDAKAESLANIKYFSSLIGKTSLKKILVFGCLVKLMKEELLKIKGVFACLNINQYSEIIENFDDRVCDAISFSSSLKISDGCNKKCSYCIIPYIRGNYKSYDLNRLYVEAFKMAENGTKELNIVAQDTLYYGMDVCGKKQITVLLNKLSTIKKLEWIRLLYCYPEEMDDEIIDLIKTNKKIVKYIDIPIQHISNRILKLMNRATTKERIVNLINKLRNNIHDICIRTTFIVGFPGETEEDFDELLQFVKEIKFDKIGVFTYSREENTTSFYFENQIKNKIKNERKRKLLMAQKDLLPIIKSKYLNKVYKVLVEGYVPSKKQYVGRSYFDARDIDDVIYFKSNKEIISGTFVNVKINKIIGYDLEGELV